MTVAAAVRTGLLRERKALPAWLLYDEAGCALYERITRLPEYYLTRAEAEIFDRHGEAIVAAASHDGARLSVAELGAGSAVKTEALLAAVVRRQGPSRYLASDIAPAAIEAAALRLRGSLPEVEVALCAGAHEALVPALAALPDRQLLLFIGSSIGNFPDDGAVSLLAAMRVGLRRDGLLLLGTDLRKEPAVLRAAYDDAAGVTAAFSLNLLTRLNRELGADFDLEGFRHVAEWDEAASNIEIFLEARRAQRVRIEALGAEVHFASGERIHTESSAKYDLPRVERLLGAAGLVRAESWYDGERRFAVHLARVATRL